MDAITKEINWVKEELEAIENILSQGIDGNAKIELLIKKTCLQEELDRLNIWENE